MSTRPMLAVNVFSYAPPPYPWILAHLDEPRLQWRNFYMHAGDDPSVPSGLAACAAAVWAVRSHRGDAVLITHGPEATRRCALLCRMSLFRPRHIAFSFHFAQPPSRRTLAAQWACDHMVDQYVTYSALEADVSSRRFRIRRSKIEHTHWPYEPDDIVDDTPLAERTYACAVGGSGRDYRTLIEAAALVPDIRLVLVARPQNVAGLKLSDNVELRTLIPKDEAWSLLAHCRLSVLPLLDSRSHCGHSCLVQAMHYGVPVVATRSEGLHGYVTDGETARLSPCGDVQALARCMRELWDDPQGATRLGAAGRAHARAELSPERAAAWTARLLLGG